MMLLLVLSGALPLSAQDQDSLLKQSRFEDFRLQALNTKGTTTSRVRAIDELGRWGTKDLVSDLRLGLRKEESPEIRMATMRAMMRLNVDAVRDDISAIFNEPDVEPEESAWAARALGQSKEAKSVVPQLIPHLKAEDAGTRAAVVESLRKLTGLTLGASQSNLLFPVTEPESLDTHVNRWDDWWQEYQNNTPEEWRLSALKSERTADRAAAARSMALASQTDGIPALIQQLKREPASGVREALAGSLAKLTGVAANVYKPFRPEDMTQEDWDTQHAFHIKKWEDAYGRIQTGSDSLLAGLDDDNPRTRLDALLKLKLRGAEQPLEEYLRKLDDGSPAVAEQAWKNLVNATGVAWPFNADAEPALKKIQIERWQQWFAEHDSAEARLLSVFRPVDTMHWGMSGADEKMREQAARELADAVMSIRSNVARFLADGAVRVNPEPLREAFRRETDLCREALHLRAFGDERPSSGLQYHLVLALGNLADVDAATLLLDRLRLAREAARFDLPPEVLDSLNDIQVKAACVQSIGLLGNAGLGAANTFEEMLDPASEPSVRVRAQAVIALARLGDDHAYPAMVEMLESDTSPYGQMAAVEAIAMLIRVHPELRDEVIERLYAAGDDKRKAKDVRDAARAYARLLGQ